MTNEIIESERASNSSGLKDRIFADLLEIESAEVRKSHLEDVTALGCTSGVVSDLIYYDDTEAYYKEYEREIWELVNNMAEELGHKSALEFLSTLNGAEHAQDSTTLHNLLAWFAYEETARAILEME